MKLSKQFVNLFNFFPLFFTFFTSWEKMAIILSRGRD